MKPRPLTLKQQRFVKAIADPTVTSYTQAARMAGYKTPARDGSLAVRKGQIQAAVQAELERQGNRGHKMLDRSLTLASKALARSECLEDPVAQIAVARQGTEVSKVAIELCPQSMESLTHSQAKHAGALMLRAYLTGARAAIAGQSMERIEQALLRALRVTE